ncbi:hypothetical protein GOC65_24055 [Sinorhizobium meliloti]|nr:hypothetical protein [Sinorhizobium meliloti]
MKQLLVATSAAALSVEVAVACELDISDYVGWTIIYSGTVTGYIDENGQVQDQFNGCTHNRVLIVDNDKAVTCNEYSYSYAYRPDIVILSNGPSLKACIDDEMYDVRR